MKNREAINKAMDDYEIAIQSIKNPRRSGGIKSAYAMANIGYTYSDEADANKRDDDIIREANKQAGMKIASEEKEEKVKTIILPSKVKDDGTGIDGGVSKSSRNAEVDLKIETAENEALSSPVRTMPMKNMVPEQYRDLSLSSKNTEVSNTMEEIPVKNMIPEQYRSLTTSTARKESKKELKKEPKNEILANIIKKLPAKTKKQIMPMVSEEYRNLTPSAKKSVLDNIVKKIPSKSKNKIMPMIKEEYRNLTTTGKNKETPKNSVLSNALRGVELDTEDKTTPMISEEYRDIRNSSKNTKIEKNNILSNALRGISPDTEDGTTPMIPEQYRDITPTAPSTPVPRQEDIDRVMQIQSELDIKNNASRSNMENETFKKDLTRDIMNINSRVKNIQRIREIQSTLSNGEEDYKKSIDDGMKMSMRTVAENYTAENDVYQSDKAYQSYMNTNPAMKVNQEAFMEAVGTPPTYDEIKDKQDTKREWIKDTQARIYNTTGSLSENVLGLVDNYTGIAIQQERRKRLDIQRQEYFLQVLEKQGIPSRIGADGEIEVSVDGETFEPVGTQGFMEGMLQSFTDNPAQMIGGIAVAALAGIATAASGGSLLAVGAVGLGASAVTDAAFRVMDIKYMESATKVQLEKQFMEDALVFNSIDSVAVPLAAGAIVSGIGKSVSKLSKVRGLNIANKDIDIISKSLSGGNATAKTIDKMVSSPVSMNLVSKNSAAVTEHMEGSINKVGKALLADQQVIKTAIEEISNSPIDWRKLSPRQRSGLIINSMLKNDTRIAEEFSKGGLKGSIQESTEALIREEGKIALKEKYGNTVSDKQVDELLNANVAAQKMKNESYSATKKTAEDYDISWNNRTDKNGVLKVTAKELQDSVNMNNPLEVTLGSLIIDKTAANAPIKLKDILDISTKNISSNISKNFAPATNKQVLEDGMQKLLYKFMDIEQGFSSSGYVGAMQQISSTMFDLTRKSDGEIETILGGLGLPKNVSNGIRRYSQELLDELSTTGETFMKVANNGIETNLMKEYSASRAMNLSYEKVINSSLFKAVKPELSTSQEGKRVILDSLFSKEDKVQALNILKGQAREMGKFIGKDVNAVEVIEDAFIKSVLQDKKIDYKKTHQLLSSANLQSKQGVMLTEEVSKYTALNSELTQSIAKEKILKEATENTYSSLATSAGHTLGFTVPYLSGMGYFMSTIIGTTAGKVTSSIYGKFLTKGTSHNNFINTIYRNVKQGTAIPREQLAKLAVESNIPKESVDNILKTLSIKRQIDNEYIQHLSKYGVPSEDIILDGIGSKDDLIMQVSKKQSVHKQLSNNSSLVSARAIDRASHNSSEVSNTSNFGYPEGMITLVARNEAAFKMHGISKEGMEEDLQKIIDNEYENNNYNTTMWENFLNKYAIAVSMYQQYAPVSGIRVQNGDGTDIVLKFDK